MNQCLPRSASALIEAVAVCAVETNIRYQRRDVTGDGHPETWCNLFVHDVTALLGCTVPFVLANMQILWLQGEGQKHGWAVVDAAEAQRRAELGQPAVATWFNDAPKGHGHVALVVPKTEDRPGVYIAQAGATNFSCGPARQGFGNLPIRFFAHD